MAGKTQWSIALVILVYSISVWGKPNCKTRFVNYVMCTAGKDDYILRRGLVSDNNNTITIKLKSCRITEVDLEAFKNNYNLEEIDLSRNKIVSLEKGILDGLRNLRTIQLSQNLLKSLPLGLFDQLPNFNRLDISFNKIFFLELGIFDHTPKLLSLELAGNAVTGKDLDPSFFERIPNLLYLHLSGNNMSQSPDNLLQALQKLKILGLNNCSLTDVPKFATSSNLKTLERLLLQNNEIKRIDDPTTFANLENLLILDLLQNMIDNLHADVFKPLRKLNFLDLAFNKLEYIPEYMFQNMLWLRNIDLSYNLMNIIPVSAFYRTRLHTLRLNANRISFLDRNFCAELGNNRFGVHLSTFEFHDNPFQCACLLEILNEVKKFGIAYNSDKYNGEKAVCFMTNEFNCMRNNSEFEYLLDVRKLPEQN